MFIIKGIESKFKLGGWWSLFLLLFLFVLLLFIPAKASEADVGKGENSLINFNLKLPADPKNQASPVALEELEGIVLEKSPALRLSALYLEQLRLNESALSDTRNALLRSLDGDAGAGEFEEIIMEAPPDVAMDASLDVRMNRIYISEIIDNFINPNLKGNQEAMQANREAMEKQRDSQVKNLSRNIEDMALAIRKTELQQELTQAQLVYTAEQMYITVNLLTAQVAEISLNLDFLRGQLRSLQVQEEVGLITKFELWPLENSIADLEKVNRELLRQKERLELELKQLLGYDFQEQFALGGVPSPERYALLTQEFDAVLEIGAAHNFSLRASDLEIAAKSLDLYRTWLDFGMYATEYQVAQVGLEIEKEKTQETKRKLAYTLFTLISNVQQSAISLEEARDKLLDYMDRLGTARAKLDSGVIPRDAFLKEQNDYLVHQAKVKILEIELLQHSHKYNWFLKGIDPGGGEMS